MLKDCAFIVLLITLFFQPIISPATTAGSQDELVKNIPAHMTFQAQWDTGKDSSVRNIGTMTVTITGDLQLNEEFSSQGKGIPAVMTVYSGKNLVGSYSYQEKQYQKHPPDNCSDLLAQYDGAGEFQIPAVSPFATGLQINRLDSLIKKQIMGNPMAAAFLPPEAKEKMIDHYNFFVGSERQRVSGQKRSFTQCNYQPDSKEITPAAITLRFQVDGEAKMKGARNWRARKSSGSPSFTIKLSDLPVSMEKRPFSPPQEPDGEVSYSVAWNFGEMDPVVLITMKKDGTWIPISDQTVNDIVTGDKIELQGVVYPKKKDPGTGRWTITHEKRGETTGFIKKYHASFSNGEVEYLDPENDMDQRDIVFYWTTGGGAKVEYETEVDKKPLRAETRFDIIKPKFSFTAMAAQENIFGPLNLGSSHENQPCCANTASPEQNNIIKECEEIEKQLSQLNPNDSWDMNTVKPKYLNQLEELGCRPDGIQYGGINFIAQPLDDHKGKVRFVQTLSRSIIFDLDGKREIKNLPHGLDGCYPYPKKPNSEYQAYDSPGFGVRSGSSQERRELTFEMYLLFKPESKESEWVPISVVNWLWAGAIGCDNNNCRMDDSGSRFSPPLQNGTDTDQYPEWNRCSMGE